jgi:hypothetical protein
MRQNDVMAAVGVAANALAAVLRARYFRHITCGYWAGFVARMRYRDVWEHNKDAASGNP